MALKQHEKGIAALVLGTSTFFSAMLSFCQQMTSLLSLLFSFRSLPWSHLVLKRKIKSVSQKIWIDETQFMTVVWLPYSSSSLIRITAWGAPQPLCFYGNQILSSQNPKCCWKIFNILAIPCVKQTFGLYLRWKTELHNFFFSSSVWLPVFKHVGERISLSPTTVGEGEVISWQPQENLNLLAMAETLQNK